MTRLEGLRKGSESDFGAEIFLIDWIAHQHNRYCVEQHLQEYEGLLGCLVDFFRPAVTSRLASFLPTNSMLLLLIGCRGTGFRRWYMDDVSTSPFSDLLGSVVVHRRHAMRALGVSIQ